MSELRVLAACALLAGGIAAAVSATVLRYGPEMVYGTAEPPRIAARIASVRLAELAAAHAARIARADTAPGEIAAATRAWAVALEAALARVALHHGAVLLPARAVAAGAPDLTAEVEAAMARVMAGQAPTEPAPETKP